MKTYLILTALLHPILQTYLPLSWSDHNTSQRSPWKAENNFKSFHEDSKDHKIAR